MRPLAGNIGIARHWDRFVDRGFATGRVENDTAVVDNELNVGKPLGVGRQKPHPPRTCDENRKAVRPGSMEQSVAAAVREHCALAGGENEGAQRLEAGRSGQRLDPAFDPRVAQVHSDQEGEPLRMAQRRRFGVRSHGRKAPSARG